MPALTRLFCILQLHYSAARHRWHKRHALHCRRLEIADKLIPATHEVRPLTAGVNAFSRFEKEVPKLEVDDRWGALKTLKERRAAFDDFCKNYAEQQRKMKEARDKAALTSFQELLEEAAAAGEGRRRAALGFKFSGRCADSKLSLSKNIDFRSYLGEAGAAGKPAPCIWVLIAVYCNNLWHLHGLTYAPLFYSEFGKPFRPISQS